MGCSFLTVKAIRSTQELLRIQRGKVALVDFSAPWCAPCSLQEPIIRRIAARFAGTAVVGRVNIDEISDVASKLDIQHIPTLIIFSNNREVARFIGLHPESTISQALQRVIR